MTFRKECVQKLITECVHKHGIYRKACHGMWTKVGYRMFI